MSHWQINRLSITSSIEMAPAQQIVRRPCKQKAREYQTTPELFVEVEELISESSTK